MDRMLPLRALAALLLLGLGTPADAMPVTLRVVDQNGQELTGSNVSLVGGDTGDSLIEGTAEGASHRPWA